MKNLLIFLIVLFTNNLLTAQNAWEAPLQAQITAADKIKTAKELKIITAAVERIALSNSTEWLPAYHAAYFNSQLLWRFGKEACNNCMDQMDKFLETAEKANNNSEVLALRANYYQAKLQGSPMMAPYYGPKAGNILKVALNEDPNNPRANLLMGQNLFHTPEMFGGGVEKAKPYLEKASKLFAVSNTTPTILPNWGKYMSGQMDKELASNK